MTERRKRLVRWLSEYLSKQPGYTCGLPMEIDRRAEGVEGNCVAEWAINIFVLALTEWQKPEPANTQMEVRYNSAISDLQAVISFLQKRFETLAEFVDKEFPGGRGTNHLGFPESAAIRLLKRLKEKRSQTPEQPTRAEGQIAKLADFIMAEIPGEPSQSEGAVDCAIRLLKRLKVTEERLATRKERPSCPAKYPDPPAERQFKVGDVVSACESHKLAGKNAGKIVDIDYGRTRILDCNGNIAERRNSDLELVWPVDAMKEKL